MATLHVSSARPSCDRTAALRALLKATPSAAMTSVRPAPRAAAWPTPGSSSMAGTRLPCPLTQCPQHAPGQAVCRPCPAGGVSRGGAKPGWESLHVILSNVPRLHLWHGISLLPFLYFFIVHRFYAMSGASTI